MKTKPKQPKQKAIKAKFYPNKFVPTYEVLKQIDEIVPGLPAVPLANSLGGVMRCKFIETVNGYTYNVTSKAQLINHKVELISAYRKFGKEGIELYLNHVSEYQKQVDEVTKQFEIEIAKQKEIDEQAKLDRESIGIEGEIVLTQNDK